jgi:hypothetical protein
MGVIKFSTGKATRKGVTATNKKKAESVKPKVNRGVPKQKIEAKAKRLSAAKRADKFAIGLFKGFKW